MLFLVCAGLVVLAQRRTFAPRLLAVRALPVLSCAAIGVWALRRANQMNFHPSLGSGASSSTTRSAQRLAQIPERLINFLPGRVDELVVVVLVACWLALARHRRARALARATTRGALPPHVWGPELCFARRAGALPVHAALDAAAVLLAHDQRPLRRRHGAVRAR